MTIRELIDELTYLVESDGVDPDAEVRLAHQPRWPFEYDLRQVVAVDPNRPDDGDALCPDHEVERRECGCVPEDFDDEDGESVVYLGEGSQIGYLPGVAAHALGWGR